MLEELGCTLLDGDVHRAAWNDFVESCDSPESRSRANLGHRFEWGTVFRAAYGCRVHRLAALRNDALVGVLPLVHMSRLGGNRLVSLPFLDRAGILADSKEVASALQQAALRLARRVGASGLELRSTAPREAAPGERALLVLELPDRIESLWRALPAKVRNQIRKAEKSGLRTTTGGAGQLHEFREVFARNMRDLGSPVHSARFFREILDAFGEKARLYLTRDGSGATVAVALALHGGGTITVPWASSLRQARPMCPNHALYWKILEDGVASGASRLDFGRSWRDSGTWRFKAQWGADPRGLEWMAYDDGGERISPRSLRPSEHSVATRVWARLPLGLVNRLGPMLRRHLAN